MRIRSAICDDAEQAAVLLHLAQGKASIPVHGMGSLEAALKFYRWMFCQRNTFWSYDMTRVAVDGDEIVGLIACYPNDAQREHRTVHNNAALRDYFGTTGLALLAEYCRRHTTYGDGTPSHAAESGIYINNLAVALQHRRRGIATALLNTADEVCQELGYSCCCLHVEEGNEAALKLFESHGYLVVAHGNGPGCQELCGFRGYSFMVKEARARDDAASLAHWDAHFEGQTRDLYEELAERAVGHPACGCNLRVDWLWSNQAAPDDVAIRCVDPCMRHANSPEIELLLAQWLTAYRAELQKAHRALGAV